MKTDDALKEFANYETRCIDEIDELKKIFYNFFIGGEEKDNHIQKASMQDENLKQIAGGLNTKPSQKDPTNSNALLKKSLADLYAEKAERRAKAKNEEMMKSSKQNYGLQNQD